MTIRMSNLERLTLAEIEEFVTTSRQVTWTAMDRILSLKTQNQGRASSPVRHGASRLAIGSAVNEQCPAARVLRTPTVEDKTNDRSLPAAAGFQAHLALESALDFRLVCGLEMLRHEKFRSSA